MAKTAPNFKLPDQNGDIRTLDEFKGRWLVVFFYPKDNSLNCVREVCAFRDEHSIIAQFGNAEVIGINNAPVVSHEKFATKQKLNFPILSDESLEVTKAYGAWRTGKPKIYDAVFATRRNTYLVNPKGQIVKEYLSVNPATHAEEVIQDLQALQQNAKV